MEQLDSTAVAVIVVIVGCVVFCVVGFILGRLSVRSWPLSSFSVSDAVADLEAAQKRLETVEVMVEVEEKELDEAVASAQPEDSLAAIVNARREEDR